MVQVLLEYGADVGVRGQNLETPLHVAARVSIHYITLFHLNKYKMMKKKMGYTEIVEELLKNGSEVNGVDCYTRTALHKAVYLSHPATVSALLRQPSIDLEVKESAYVNECECEKE